MEIVVNTLMTYKVDIIVALVTLVALYGVNLYLVRADKSGKVKRILRGLCIEAEKYLGSSTGKLKKEQVVTWFLGRYKFISLFVDKETLSNDIDCIVKELDDYLSSNNANLNSLDSEVTSAVPNVVDTTTK